MTRDPELEQQVLEYLYSRRGEGPLNLVWQDAPEKFGLPSDEAGWDRLYTALIGLKGENSLTGEIYVNRLRHVELGWRGLERLVTVRENELTEREEIVERKVKSLSREEKSLEQSTAEAEAEREALTARQATLDEETASLRAAEEASKQRLEKEEEELNAGRAAQIDARTRLEETEAKLKHAQDVLEKDQDRLMSERATMEREHVTLMADCDALRAEAKDEARVASMWRVVGGFSAILVILGGIFVVASGTVSF